TAESARLAAMRTVRFTAEAPPARFSAVAFAADEALDLVARDVVGDLPRRVLHEVRRHAEQRPADAAIASELPPADRVQRAACRVRAVLDREARLELDLRTAEALTLDPQEADLVVLLPRHVVARADVDVLAVHALRQVRLHGLGLRHLLEAEPLAIQ